MSGCGAVGVIAGDPIGAASGVIGAAGAAIPVFDIDPRIGIDPPVWARDFSLSARVADEPVIMCLLWCIVVIAFTPVARVAVSVAAIIRILRMSLSFRLLALREQFPIRWINAPAAARLPVAAESSCFGGTRVALAGRFTAC